MSVTVQFKCSGCGVEYEPITARARRQGVYSGGAGVTHDGWVRTVRPTFEELAPEGWVAFDPYTLLCYCAECWASIESEPMPPNLAVGEEGR